MTHHLIVYARVFSKNECRVGERLRHPWAYISEIADGVETILRLPGISFLYVGTALLNAGLYTELSTGCLEHRKTVKSLLIPNLSSL